MTRVIGTGFERKSGGLVITRKPQEELAMIDTVNGEYGRIGVTEISGRSAHIFFELPGSKELVRAEILFQHYRGIYDAIRDGSRLTEEQIRDYLLRKEAFRTGRPNGENR
jgi:hypothetical protein